MKTRNPKLWLACGQHINASDDNCTDLARHAFTMEEFEKMKKQSDKSEAKTRKACEEGCTLHTHIVTLSDKPHTPTPWEANGSCYVRRYTKDDEIIDVALVANEIDATFIVRAVNQHEALLSSHEDLMETLLAVKQRLEAGLDNKYTLKIITDALATAEGKGE